MNSAFSQRQTDLRKRNTRTHKSNSAEETTKFPVVHAGTKYEVCILSDEHPVVSAELMDGKTFPLVDL